MIDEGACLTQTRSNRTLILFLVFFPSPAKTEWNMKKGSEHKPKSFLHKPEDVAVTERIIDIVAAELLSCSSHYPLSTFH